MVENAFLNSTCRNCVVEAEATETATLFIASALVEEGLSECVRSLVEDALNEAKKEKSEHLEALRKHFERKQLLKFWRRLDDWIMQPHLKDR